MKKISLLITFFLAFVSFSTVSAQMKEGMVKYEVTDVESSDPSTEAGLSMMKGGALIVYFTPSQQRVDMDMMGGMVNMTTLHSSADSNTIMLMEVMGKKMKVTMDPEKMNEMKNQSMKGEQDMPKPKIEHFKNETLDILGYKCHKVLVTASTKEMDTEMILYVTDDVHMIRSVAKGVEDLDLGGTALQYTVDVKGMMKMTYKATEIKDNVDAEVFKVDMTKYDEVDPSQLGGMFGG